ncbi:hypothetical protein GGQ68_004354 [Sagittula marina]|uniref:Uncharacterized protein n=1 Tax=Sagittula marina TaxID=943940 RepID=A0A7W6DRP8_9RHOB|nr:MULTISPECIES: hypothetical protein [Rhodobacterales]MBB3988000.1 hypothetical protein [Sagittula marina]NIZ10177.1 hypothetical protein [Pseudooceanicola sp. HF7]
MFDHRAQLWRLVPPPRLEQVKAGERRQVGVKQRALSIDGFQGLNGMQWVQREG